MILVFYTYLIYTDVAAHIMNQPKSMKDQNEINEYMFNWLSDGGNAFIFTRDMSWAGVQKIERLLYTKARNNELSICLPQQTKLTKSLCNHGADILTYGELNYTPKSRFTIINKDRMDACVAVGRWVNKSKSHIIKEYSSGQDPIFNIADDLIEILKKINRDGVQEKCTR